MKSTMRTMRTKLLLAACCLPLILVGCATTTFTSTWKAPDAKPLQFKAGEKVIIDGTGEYVDHDVKEVIATFIADAPRREILVTLRGLDLSMAAPGGGH